MRYEEMNTYQKGRIRLGATCVVCGKTFNKLDDMQELNMRYGRSILHFYFHSACLLQIKGLSQLGGAKNEEEEIEKAII